MTKLAFLLKRKSVLLSITIFLEFVLEACSMSYDIARSLNVNVNVLILNTYAT